MTYHHHSTLTDVEQAYQVLVQAGLVSPQTPIRIEPVSDAERLQAADAYGQAGPLSAWIIAERDDA